MRNFLKIFLLLLAGAALFLGSAALAGTTPFLLALLGILLSAGIMIGGLLILRRNKKLSHRFPRDKEKEYNEWYKSQFKKE